jgi:hypothetical protein
MQFARLQGIQEDTLRDLAERFKLVIVSESRQEVLQCFQLLGCLSWDAVEAGVISASNSRRIMRELGVAEPDVIAFKEVAAQPMVRSKPQATRASAGGSSKAGPSSQSHREAAPVTKQPARIVQAARPKVQAPPTKQPAETVKLPDTIPVLEGYDPDTDPWAYGLDNNSLTPRLEAEFESFSDWSAQPINLRRGQEYAGAAKEATISSTMACIKAFLGYSAGYAGLPRSKLSLQLYNDPHHFVNFLAYLIARGLSKPSLIKHIAVARKVVYYLRSGVPETSPGAAIMEKVRNWMAALESQVQRSMPNAKPKQLPEFSAVLKWVDWVTDDAKRSVDSDMSSMQSLCRDTAEKVQQAIMAHLVTGSTFPTVRIDLIRNLRHPDRLSCDDPNCQERSAGCKGNRLEVEDDGLGQPWHEDAFGLGTIKLHIVHGKNDRRRSRAAYNVQFDIPDGDLVMLLRAHIRLGSSILANNGDPPTKLFVRASGTPFSKSSLSQYWSNKVMDTARQFQISPVPMQYFRTLFVENFTCTEGGMPEELWEGAAIIMGNSTATWRSNYWPSMRKRKAELVVGQYDVFTSHHRPGGRPVAGDDDDEEEEDGEGDDDEHLAAL